MLPAADKVLVASHDAMTRPHDRALAGYTSPRDFNARNALGLSSPVPLRMHSSIPPVWRRLPRWQAIDRRVNEYRLHRLRKRLAGPRLLRAFAQAFPEATFIEIGANDGKQLDHLRSLVTNREWRGVMVEPLPYVFDRLRENHVGFERVALENAAVATFDGFATIHHLAQEADPAIANLPPWYDAIGSFSREHVLAHKVAIPDIESRLVETVVPCLTFDSLCAKHKLERVDLLAIDTEGYDYEILRHIDLSRHRPVLIVYEHRHFGPADRAACQRLLQDARYDLMEEGHETWCLRQDADPSLSRLWRRLRPAVPGIAAYEEGWKS